MEYWPATRSRRRRSHPENPPVLGCPASTSKSRLLTPAESDQAFHLGLDSTPLQPVADRGGGVVDPDLPVDDGRAECAPLDEEHRSAVLGVGGEVPLVIRLSFGEVKQAKPPFLEQVLQGEPLKNRANGVRRGVG